MMKSIEGFIYLIEFNGKFKIGKSIHPEKRLKQLALGSEAKLIWSKSLIDYHNIEKYMHEYFLEKQYSNEWYSLDEDDIEFICNVDNTTMLEEGFGEY